MKNYKTKDFSGGFEDVDLKKGVVVGYLADFNSKDSDRDIIRKGSFLKSIQERGPKSARPRIKHLMNHNIDWPVGRFDVLEEDTKGLRYESFAGRHTNGRDFLLMVEDGIITEHSIGYKTVQEIQRADYNELIELYLMEGSSLTCWGANERTPIVGVKSEDFGAVASLMGRMEKLIKGLRNGSYSDAAMSRLELELEQIQSQLKALIDEAPSKEERPGEETPTDLPEGPPVEKNDEGLEALTYLFT